MTITEFLEARIAEDEADAQHALVGPHKTAVPWVGVFRVVEDFDGGTAAEAASHWLAAHIARHDPARVLAECAAKRAIIEAHHINIYASQRGEVPECVLECRGNPCDTLQALASVHKDHPDYEPGWAL